MKVNAVSIPDFALNDTYQPRHKAKYECIHKFHPQEIESNRYVNAEVSLQPNHEFLGKCSERPGSVPSQPYQKQFQVNRLQDKAKNYWNQNDAVHNSFKQFPAFKAPMRQYNKEHNLLKPTILPCSSVHLKEYSKKTELSPIRPRHREDPSTPENKCNNSNILNTSKKVKWEDGYCASPRLEWYPLESEYRNVYKNYLPSKREPSYSNGYFLAHRNKEYNERPDYRDYTYMEYDYFKYKTPASYPSSFRKLQSDGYEYYNLKYPRTSRYGTSDNWLYMEEDSRYNPYQYDYGYRNFRPRRYRNSNTQYDLIEKMHNKKLQVCQSEASKISDRKIKVERKKVGVQKKGIRLTRSEGVVSKCEDIGTQISENEPQSHQTFSILCNPDTKSNDTHRLNDTTVLSKLLMELSEKLKHSEDHLAVSEQKCSFLEKGTQYIDCVKKKLCSPKRTSAKKHSKMNDAKNHLKQKKSNLKVVQNESTQYEDMKSSENATSSTLNTEFEFERKFFRKDSDRENFCEIASTKKRKGRNCGVCEERIYAKRLVKEKSPTVIMRELRNINGSQESSKSESSDQRSNINTKHCLPFFFDERLERNPYEFQINFDKSKIKEKSRRHRWRKRSTSCEIEGEKSKRKNQDQYDRKTNSNSVHSSRSAFSDPEERYLEKYVVKLCHPKEEIILYDVKPELRDFLSSKGFRKKIVQKLKSSVKD